MFGIEISTREVNSVLSGIMKFFDANTVCFTDNCDVINGAAQAEIGECLSLSDMIGLVENKENYFIFARIFLYANEKSVKCIETVQELERSRCIGVVLLTDANFIEVYLKDRVQSAELFKAFCKAFPNVQMELSETSRTSLTIF